MQIPKLDHLNENDQKKLLAWSPLKSSVEFGWHDLLFERRDYGSFETIEYEMVNHYLMVKRNTHSTAYRRIAGRLHKEIQHRGSTVYIPHGCSHSVTYPKDMGSLYLIAMSNDIVQKAADFLGISHFQGIPHSAVIRDDFVLAMGTEIEVELDEGNPNGLLFLDHISHLLSMHVVRKSHENSHKKRINKEGLSPYNLRLSIDYIQAHSDRSIRLEDLASLVSLSTFHFIRAFKAATGLSPMRFIIHQRVKVAEQLLAKSDYPIEQVAATAGFSSSSQCGKHFRKIHGISPSQFRARIIARTDY